MNSDARQGGRTASADSLASSRLAAISHHLEAGVVEEDRERTVTHINDRFCEIFGIADGDTFVGGAASILFAEIQVILADPERLVRLESRLLESGEAVAAQVVELTNGTIVELDYVPMMEGAQIEGHLWLYRDVTARVRSEERLRFQARVLSQVNDAIVTVGPDMAIRYWNRGAEELTGIKGTEAIGRGPEELLRFRFEKWEEEHEAWSQLSDSGRWQGEIIVMPKGATSERYVSVNASLLQQDDSSFGGLIAVIRDVTERREMEDRLIHHAYHDTLTSLPNRMMFLRTLDGITSKDRDSRGTYAVLFLDLDRFKLVNDSLGHHAGDTMLKVLAYRLKKCVRGKDIIARLGGDEFAVLIQKVENIDSAIEVADRIGDAMKAPFIIEGMEVYSAVSIGVVLGDDHYDAAEDVIRDADTAMYQAKRAGRSCYAVFDQTQQMQTSARFQLESDLRRALNREELRVYYQPVVDLRSGTLTGFEALVRWAHEERGVVSPRQFISVAEESGLIVEIDEWVIREALRQLKAWDEQFGDSVKLKMNVNFAHRTFHQRNLSDFVSDVLSDASLDASRLSVEITERVLIDDNERAASELNALKEQGVQVCIDDFGTGYASLSILHTLPIDIIKIDRSFVERIDQQDDGLRMVQTVIDLAHGLGMDSVAEGIETHRQVEELTRMKCAFGQGYYFSRPVDSDAAAALIGRRVEWMEELLDGVARRRPAA